MTTTDLHIAGGITVSGLVKSYGPVQAVRGVNIDIAVGETVAFLGPNGAGKSTTIDMILGLTKPDAGQVSLFGVPPAQAVQRGLVGAMLQTGSLIRDLTVRELLVVMASLYPKPLAVDEVLDITGTTEFASRRTHKLSGGQTQRVRFAVALVANPDLLVLDEPTAALDVEARREFWAVMRGFADRGKTVLFATHYLEEADAYADRIVLMARGQVVADGPTAEIKAKVGNRTIRATIPDVERAVLERLPGVTALDVRGEAITLTCGDADAALHQLLRTYPEAHGIEVRGAGLEEAFMELTADPTEVALWTAVTYTRYEVLRCFRNTRFFIFSLAFPLILFFLVAGANKNGHIDNVKFPLYYMTGMMSFGTMTAVVSGGARIAAERSVGWTRQMRLTPLSVWGYFQAKLLSGYLMALVSIVLLGVAGTTLGVHLSAAKWLTVAGLILVGLIPFAVLGIVLGHLLTVESMGPALGGVTTLFSLLGGAFGPLVQHGIFHTLTECIPSYWLVQAGKIAYNGNGWPPKAWIVIAAWTVVLVRIARVVYRRDTVRV